jgi:FtsZ-binding cell division protein ZapB
MQRLYVELDDVKLENAQLRQELSTFEEVFRELKRLNEELAADLRQSRKQRVPSLTSALLGQAYGRY